MDVSTLKQPHYRFPLLKNNEIVECLTDAGIEISSNELTEPNRHKDKVKAIFIELVLLGLNLPKETFTSTSISLMKKRQNLSNPELHEESFSNFKFSQALMKLMLICGINDFGMHDLYAPTTKRFKRQLSGIINFIKFTIEKQASLFNEINEQKDDLVAQLLEVQKEQEKLNQLLLNVKADAEQRWNEVQVVDDDCGEIECEITKQNKLQTSIRQESENLKKQANVLKDKIATAELSIQELAVKQRKFSSQVVESPDKLKEEIQSQTSLLQKEKRLCENAEQDAKAANWRVKNVTTAQDDVVEATNLIKQVIDVKVKYDKSFEESKSFEDRITENEVKSADYNKMCEELENQLIGIKDKNTTFKQQAITKMDAAKASLHSINAELLIVEKDRRDANAKVEQCEHEVQLLKRVIDEDKSTTDKEISDIVMEFMKLQTVLEAKVDKFDKMIEESKEISLF